MTNTTLHLVWDFDGTLYDSYPSMAAALQAALATFGVTADARKLHVLLKRTLYFSVCTMAERNGLAVDMLMAAFRAQHKLHMAFSPMAHAAECLAKTADMGCRHYLFTHRDNGAVDMLRADGLAPYFTDFVTREDGFADKPSPEAILHLMRKHAFTGANTFMVGDRDIDVQSGQATGAQGILFDPEGFYPDLAVAHRIDSLADVTEIIRRRLASGQ